MGRGRSLRSLDRLIDQTIDYTRQRRPSARASSTTRSCTTACRTAHRGRGAARADLPRGRDVRRRQGRDQARVDGQAEVRPPVARRSRIRCLPAVLGRHGLHLGQPGVAGVSRHAGSRSAAGRRGDARHHLQARRHAAGEARTSTPAPLELPAETVAARVDGAVLHLTLNRPEVRNAMSLRMVPNCAEASARPRPTARIRVVVLRGAGGHFCAGGDINDMAAARMKARGRGRTPMAQVNAQFGELCAAFARTPAGGRGGARGHRDGRRLRPGLRRRRRDRRRPAWFACPTTSLGVVPAQIAPYLVERIGYSQAKRLGRHRREDRRRGGARDRPRTRCIALGRARRGTARVLAKSCNARPTPSPTTKRLDREGAPASRARTWSTRRRPCSPAASLGPEGVEGTMAFLQKRKGRTGRRSEFRRKILIANRGEVACRVMRTAQSRSATEPSPSSATPTPARRTCCRPTRRCASARRRRPSPT